MPNASEVHIDIPLAERAELESLSKSWRNWWTSDDSIVIDDRAIRCTELFVDVGHTVAIRSLAKLISPKQEVFRLSFARANSSASPDSESAKRFSSLKLGSRPKLLLLWKRLEYEDVILRRFGTLTAVAPTGFLMVSDRARLLVCPDELPTWLRCIWNSSEVEDEIKSAAHIDLVAC